MERSAPSSCSRVRRVAVFASKVDALVAAVMAGVSATPLLDREKEASVHITGKSCYASASNVKQGKNTISENPNYKLE